MKAPVLDFYFFETCPYCQRVLNIIKKHKIKVHFKDIYADSGNLQKLVQVTGRKTVPCLFINEEPMHESQDIIDWLEKNLDHLDKTS